MCGITGIIAFDGNRKTLSHIDAAIGKLAHRGPDSSGVYRHNNVALGHTRLSVIDTSEKAAQPFSCPEGRFTIVFNGEFYNYREHREQLKKDGVTFTSASDTEVLLHLFISEKEKCLEKINGFFAFAVYDKKEDVLFLARDRMGIKPLLVFRNEKQLVFASEMQALIEFDIPREIDNVSLFTYLQLNYTPAPGTMLKGVEKLLPGHFLKISGIHAEHNDENKARIEEKSYYQIPFDPEKQKSVSPDSYQEAQKKLALKMEEAVIQRLVADVPLGTFLSGGIDSSVITAIAAKHEQKLNTFSIGYKDAPYFDETTYAQAVAKKYNTQHMVFDLTNQDFSESLEGMLNHIDEPFADSSALAVYLLSKYTREHVKVALSGDGADELFGGYNKHAAEYKARHPGTEELLAKSLSPLWKHLPSSRDSFIGNFSRKLNKFSKGLKLSPKERYWKWAGITDEETANYFLKEGKMFKVQRLTDDAYEYKKRREHYLNMLRKKGDMNDVLYADMHLVLPNDMLKKADMMSMANGLEIRTPFLDHNVVDFAFELPAVFKVNATMRKKILQDTFRSWLPPELYNRPKQGFEVPLLQLLTTSFRPLVEKLLDEEFMEAQGIFNPAAINELKSRLFSKNPGDAAARVWALVVFQHWWKRYLG